jgi:hypothetical protein
MEQTDLVSYLINYAQEKEINCSLNFGWTENHFRIIKINTNYAKDVGRLT